MLCRQWKGQDTMASPPVIAHMMVKPDSIDYESHLIGYFLQVRCCPGYPTIEDTNSRVWFYWKSLSWAEVVMSAYFFCHPTGMQAQEGRARLPLLTVATSVLKEVHHLHSSSISEDRNTCTPHCTRDLPLLLAPFIPFSSCGQTSQ